MRVGVRVGQAVFTAPLAGAELAPAAPLLERYWGARALAPPLLARQARLTVVFAVRPRGGSGPRPVETELHLPHQLQAAVGAPCARPRPLCRHLSAPSAGATDSIIRGSSAVALGAAHARAAAVCRPQVTGLVTSLRSPRSIPLSKSCISRSAL